MKDEDQSSETPDSLATDATDEQDDISFRDSHPEAAGGEEPWSDPPYHGRADELPMAERIPTPRRQGESVLEEVRKPGVRRTAGATSADIINRIERLERWVATNRP
jgi:hypothetical protein